MELEGFQNLDVSQSFSVRLFVKVHVNGWLELMHVLAYRGFMDQRFVDGRVDEKPIIKCRSFFTHVEVQALIERS